MKKFMFAAFSAALMFSCSTTRVGTTTTDDVYIVPSEERARQRAIREERAKQEALAREEAARETTTISIGDEEESPEKTKYYKDPQYSADDYYDYEYAARINRFYRPVGIGYYDSYYTNMYTYNRNPAYYGTSIYTGMSWGMPSATFNNVSFGISTGWGTGYGMYNSCYPYYSYDPWCRSSYWAAPGYGWSYPYYGWYDPYYSWGAGGYWGGYNQGYYNGYYQGLYNSPLGYYNRYDVNSNYRKMTVAPRNTNTGGNTGRRDQVQGGESQRYFENVAQEQEQRRPAFNSTRGGERIMRDRAPNETINSQRQGNPGGGRVYDADPGDGGRGNRSRNSGRIMDRQPEQTAPSRREQPVFSPNNGGRGGGGQSPRNSGGSNTSPRRR